MCGIYGAVDRGLREQDLRAMGAALAHRGPDGAGLEIWPEGDSGRAELIGVGIVADDCTGPETTGTCEVCLGLESDPDRPWRMGLVNGLKLEERNAWELLAAALVGCGLPGGEEPCGEDR